MRMQCRGEEDDGGTSFNSFVSHNLISRMAIEEPKLNQFGLSKEKYDYLKNNKDKALNKCIIICIPIAIAIASYLYLNNPNNANKTIISLIGGWILICIGLGGLGGFVSGGIICRCQVKNVQFMVK